MQQNCKNGMGMQQYCNLTKIREMRVKNDPRLKYRLFFYVSKLGYRSQIIVPLFPRARGKRREFFVRTSPDFHRLVDCGKYFLPIQFGNQRGNAIGHLATRHSDFYGLLIFHSLFPNIHHRKNGKTTLCGC